MSQGIKWVISLYKQGLSENILFVILFKPYTAVIDF